VGGSEAKAGLFESFQDENTVIWARNSKDREFAEARDLIVARITPESDAKVCPDCAEEVKAAARFVDTAVTNLRLNRTEITR
jgi:hypothetical protein